MSVPAAAMETGAILLSPLLDPSSHEPPRFFDLVGDEPMSSPTGRWGEEEQSLLAHRGRQNTELTSNDRTHKRRAVVFSTVASIVLLFMSTLGVSALMQLLGGHSLRDTSFEGLAHGLKGKQVVLVGDSLMRYKYITLVSFLETGVKLSTRPGANATTKGSHNPVDQETWQDWAEFYNGTTHSPHETCDCSREGHWGSGNENRHYVLNGYDIAYYQVFEAHLQCAMRGHTVVNAGTSPSVISLDWCYTFGGFMEFVANALRPDVVFLNSGFWAPLQPAAVTGILNAVPKIKQLIWFKTTNDRRGQFSPDRDAQVIDQLDRHPHVSIADAYTISTNLSATVPLDRVYVDGEHFFAYVYEMMWQDALLNVV